MDKKERKPVSYQSLYDALLEKNLPRTHALLSAEGVDARCLIPRTAESGWIVGKDYCIVWALRNGGV